jgi:hypothetical protein
MPPVRLEHLNFSQISINLLEAQGLTPVVHLQRGRAISFSQGQPQSKKVKQPVSWAANTILKIDSLFWQNAYGALSAPCA